MCCSIQPRVSEIHCYNKLFCYLPDILCIFNMLGRYFYLQKNVSKSFFSEVLNSSTPWVVLMLLKLCFCINPPKECEEQLLIIMLSAYMNLRLKLWDYFCILNHCSWTDYSLTRVRYITFIHMHTHIFTKYILHA